MGVTYDFEGTILMLWMAGRYTPSDIRGAIARALSEPARPVITGVVGDLRGSESITTRSLGEITGIVGFLAYVAPSIGNLIAFVVSNEAAHEVVRMGAVDLALGGVETETFRCIDQARGWMMGADDPRRGG